MSRFSDYDDYEGEPEQILAMGRWERNARVALKGKRGRKALRDLREALMALPEHRLIDSALCTVGAEERRAPLAAEVLEINAQAPKWIFPQLDQLTDFDRHVEREGEGVCAVGAYMWYRKVKAGADPAEAFASLPTGLNIEDGDGLAWTARLGKEAGLTFTLAWELAYRNDETFRNRTPEERWSAFAAWIDQELAAA